MRPHGTRRPPRPRCGCCAGPRCRAWTRSTTVPTPCRGRCVKARQAMPVSMSPSRRRCCATWPTCASAACGPNITPASWTRACARTTRSSACAPDLAPAGCRPPCRRPSHPRRSTGWSRQRWRVTGSWRSSRIRRCQHRTPRSCPAAPIPPRRPCSSVWCCWATCRPMRRRRPPVRRPPERRPPERRPELPGPGRRRRRERTAAAPPA